MPGKAWRDTGRRLASLPPAPVRQRSTDVVRQEHCEGCGGFFPGSSVRMVRVGHGDLPDAFQALCVDCRVRLDAGVEA